MVERAHQVLGVNITAPLFATVAENLIWSVVYRALDQVGKESVQLGSGMRRARETSAPKNSCAHPEVASVFLYEHVCAHLVGSEKRGRALFDAPRFPVAVRI